MIYKDTEFIIMVVGGPNIRKDYHVNKGEEFFYQIEGDMLLKIIDDRKRGDIPIKEGEIFDQSSMDTFLVQVSSIRMVSPLGNTYNDSYGLNSPQATLSIFTNDEGELQ